MGIIHTPFVGRKEELSSLNDLLTKARNGRGSTVFIEGSPGMGKHALINELESDAKADRLTENIDFVYAKCDQFTGEKDAYQPFIEILGSFAKPTVSESRKNRLVRILKAAAPDWLGAIPVAGDLIKAGYNTAVLAMDNRLAAQGSSINDKSKAMVLQFVTAIRELSSSYSPLVLVIEDAQWIDDASCQLILRLGRSIMDRKLLLVITYRPEIEKQSSFATCKSELIKDNLAELIALKGWTSEEIQDYLEKRFGRLPNQNFPFWLRDLCNGEPQFVDEYLNLLIQSGVLKENGSEWALDGAISSIGDEWHVTGALKQVIPSKKMEGLIGMRIKGLLKEEEEILELGSVQGTRFMSAVLAQLLEKKELDILRQLRQVASQRKIIRPEVNEMTSGLPSAIYVFELSLIQQIFYNKLSSYERSLYHQSIAGILEAFIDEQSIPDRRMILEVARHYENGNIPAKAAKYYFLAAKSSHSDGALKETIALCKKALEIGRKASRSTYSPKLIAEIVIMLLIASEMWWSGKKEAQDTLSLDTIMEEGEKAASEAGDLSLLSRIKYLKGKSRAYTKNLSESLDILTDSLDVSRRAGDSLAEFLILSALGHHMIGAREDARAEWTFERGLQILHEAFRIYDERLKSRTDLDRTEMDLLLSDLKCKIGVAEFDNGNLSAGEEWLSESIKGLKNPRTPVQLGWAMNFLSQLYITTGRFEEAETLLKEAIRIKDEVSGFRSYNLGLLGKLYLEWGRLTEAENYILSGQKDSQATLLIATVPLIRTFYAQLMMHPEYAKRDLEEAEKQLKIVVEESKVSKFHRSFIFGLSELGRMAIEKGNIPKALDYSLTAAEESRKRGTLPALRTEEVLYNHFRVLKAAGRAQEAHDTLSEAYQIVMNKEKTLQNAEFKKSFLERVNLNRAIIQSFGNSGT